MNLQQLRIIREAARCHYNLTEVANVLYTSQSGISRHIKELEEELNLVLFVRQGKRLIGMTEPGIELVKIAERILDEVNNIRRLSTVFANKSEGSLTIATTSAQARYVLPTVIQTFRQHYPQVHIIINQASSKEAINQLLSGDADITIHNGSVDMPPIVTYPFYRCRYTIIVPKAHPLTVEKPISLEMLTAYPLITYRQGLFTRHNIDHAFSASGLSPNIILNVQEPDEIYHYVNLGLGVGIVIEQTILAKEQPNLIQLDASHLFQSYTSQIGLKRQQLHHDYVWRFVQLCNNELSLDEIRAKVLSNEEKNTRMIDYQI